MNMIDDVIRQLTWSLFTHRRVKEEQLISFMSPETEEDHQHTKVSSFCLSSDRGDSVRQARVSPGARPPPVPRFLLLHHRVGSHGQQE